MKILKTIAKVIIAILMLNSIVLLITYFSVEPQFKISQTVKQNDSIPHIEINKNVFHSEAFGKEHQTKVIVIHGGPGFDYRYLEPLKALADSFQIIFYDQRGTGLSPRVEGVSLTLESSLEDLNDIINYYAPNEKVYLIGHSWGAMLACGYVAKHPQRIEKVVLAEPDFLTNETAKQFMEQTKGMMPPMTISSVWHILKTWLASTKLNEPDPDAGLDYLMTNIINTTDVEDHPLEGYFCNGEMKTLPYWRYGLQASINIRKSGLNKDDKFHIDLTSGLENYDNEVLFMVGDCNTLTGEVFQKQHLKRFRKTKLVVVKNAGHFMINDQPNESIDAIRAYFRP